MSETTSPCLNVHTCSASSAALSGSRSRVASWASSVMAAGLPRPGHDGTFGPRVRSYAPVPRRRRSPMLHVGPAEQPQERGLKRGPKMKKAFPIALMVLGLIFVGAGFYTMNRGVNAKDQVKSELIAQDIRIGQRFDASGKVADAAVPAKWAGKQVNSAASAKAQAAMTNHTAL